jgi:hypothetical protein
MNAITKPTDAVDEEEEIGIIILIQRFLDSPFSPNFFVICYGHPEEEKKKPQRYVYSSTYSNSTGQLPIFQRNRKGGREESENIQLMCSAPLCSWR